ncbi:MAG: hypothetical protein KKG47_12045 [Proteobacteria bacterium]|nr:hypothetical protein [Pseudomonadota bacterium]MBU1738411.1 hypothetical protein [Pseudomonadota bacterium]
MFSEKETRNCWEVADTFNHCRNNTGRQVSVKEKEEFCANCLYFTYRRKVASQDGAEIRFPSRSKVVQSEMAPGKI